VVTFKLHMLLHANRASDTPTEHLACRFAASKRGFNVRVLAMCLASKGPDHVLQDIMKGIYKACKNAAKEYDTTLQAGANIAGFLKVAEAMVAQGM